MIAQKKNTSEVKFIFSLALLPSSMPIISRVTCNNGVFLGVMKQCAFSWEMFHKLDK
jgi:hypothetical protein